MKSEKGVTLVSLIIYVIVMLIVVGIIAGISSFFYTNVNSLTSSSQATAEFTKFDAQFLAQTRKENNHIIDYKSTYISFSSGADFRFEEETGIIYNNGVKVCEYVTDFEINVIQKSEGQKIEIRLVIADSYTRTIEYVMKRSVI